ncbi:MAG: MarR family winged helix-turn-helix transcriptional regulator [Clostridium sp.]
MNIERGIIRRCEQSFLRANLSHYNLKPEDSVVLHILQKKGGCNQEALCSIMDMDKGRMARIMERMEDRLFIHRIINSADKREKLIELTETGREMLLIIDSLFEQWDEQCFIDFTAEERMQYQDYLERIAKNALARKENLEHD